MKTNQERKLKFLSTALLMGLFFPYFYHGEKNIGIFSLIHWVGNCSDERGIFSMMLFLIGWSLLLVGCIKMIVKEYKEEKIDRQLESLVFLNSVLLVFRLQDTDYSYYGNSYIFIGWGMVMAGLVIKIGLNRHESLQLHNFFAEYLNLSLLIGLLCIISLPVMEVEIYPFDAEDTMPAYIGIGGFIVEGLIKVIYSFGKLNDAIIFREQFEIGVKYIIIFGAYLLPSVVLLMFTIKDCLCKGKANAIVFRALYVINILFAMGISFILPESVSSKGIELNTTKLYLVASIFAYILYETGNLIRKKK